jgi:hypothetical protein
MKKTNLRRLLAAVLCLVMVLSLFTACSKKDNGKETNPTAPTVEIIPVGDENISSTYTTPVENSVALANAKSMKEIDTLTLNRTGGLFKTQLQSIYEIEKQSQNYAQTDNEIRLQMIVEEQNEMYGEDYAFYHEITDEDAFTQEDLKILTEEILSQAEKELKAIPLILNNNAMLESEATASGLDQEQCRKVLGFYKEIYTEMKTAKITEGYELDYTIYVKGSNLTEPTEYDSATVTVCKINGRWVCIDNLYFTSYYYAHIVNPGSMDNF